MKRIGLVLVIIVLILIIRTTSKGKHLTNHVKGVVKNIVSVPDYIDEEGDSISTRVKLPEGYKRKVYPDGSFRISS